MSVWIGRIEQTRGQLHLSNPCFNLKVFVLLHLNTHLNTPKDGREAIEHLGPLHVLKRILYLTFNENIFFLLRLFLFKKEI